MQCLKKLSDVGVDVITLAFDGAASNISMANNLSCNLDVNDASFTISFPHPVSNGSVVIFWIHVIC
jgi:hypothetical protein